MTKNAAADGNVLSIEACERIVRYFCTMINAPEAAYSTRYR